MNRNMKIIRKTVFIIILSITGIIVLYPIGFYLWLYLPTKCKYIVKPQIEFINIRESSPKDSSLLKEVDYSHTSDYLLTITSNKKFDDQNPRYKLFCTLSNIDLSYRNIENINSIIDSDNDFILIKQDKDRYVYTTAVKFNREYKREFKKIKECLTCKIFFRYYLIATYETKTFKIPSDSIEILMKKAGESTLTPSRDIPVEVLSTKDKKTGLQIR
ncbi:hypothetical protein [Bacteroides sp.]